MTDDLSPHKLDGDDALDRQIRAGLSALAAEAPAPPDVVAASTALGAEPVAAHASGGRRVLVACAAVMLSVVALGALIVSWSDVPDDTVRAGTTTTIAVGDEPLFGTRWVLESAIANGKPIDLPGSRRPPTVAFLEGTTCVGRCEDRVTAEASYEFSDGCNGGGGTLRVEGNRLIPEGGSTTLVGCSFPTVPPFGRVDGEMSVSTFLIDGDVLVLRGTDRRVLTYRAGDDGLPQRAGKILLEQGGRLAYQLGWRIDGASTVLTFDRTYDGARHESAELAATTATPFRLVADKARLSHGDLLYGLVPASATKVTYTPSKSAPINVPINRLDDSAFNAIATVVPSGDQKWSVVATDANGNEVAGQDTDYTGATIDPFGPPRGKEVARGATNYGQFRVAWTKDEGGGLGRLTLDRASATTVLPPVSIEVDTTSTGPLVTAGIGHTSVHNIIYGIVPADAVRVTYERTVGYQGPFELKLSDLPDDDRQVLVGAVPSGPPGTLRVFDTTGAEIATYDPPDS
jgi:hypothetical protein